MKKRALSVFLIAALFLIAASASFAAETGNSPAVKAEPAAANKPDLSYLNGKTDTTIFGRWSEESLKTMFNRVFGCQIDKIVYSNTFLGSLSMLKSGRADFMLAHDLTADFTIRQNPDLKAEILPVELGIVMAMRSSDAALRDIINDALKKLKENGKIAELDKKWIKELPANSDPAGNTLENGEGTETVYIGVAGDLPPLDYVAADGKPSGFNVALISEIAKLTGKKFEIVSLDSQARFAALEAKKIDVFFWMINMENASAKQALNDNIDEQENLKKFAFSDPYFTIKAAVITRK